jgi:hypothetical protein
LPTGCNNIAKSSDNKNEDFSEAFITSLSSWMTSSSSLTKSSTTTATNNNNNNDDNNKSQDWNKSVFELLHKRNIVRNNAHLLLMGLLNIPGSSYELPVPTTTAKM